jgi:DNA invertase Pin-like site-specific DNA recombinase
MDNSRNHEAGGGPASLIRTEHRQRLAVVYIRQSTLDQVRENTGSTAAQRDLVDVARWLGWPESRIRLIDSDLGLSGTSSSGRKGYLELLALMDRDEVGIVLVQVLDRLTRKKSDNALFLELAEEKGTLIYTNGALHDPASGDLASTLGLDIAGIFGNYDNRLRVRRMREAKLAKANRGQAVSPPPIGYVRTPSGEWIKDPDRAVQDAIVRVFDLYPKLGSLGKVVTYFREHGLEFPRRSHGQVRWGPVDAPFLHSVLRNPAYSGDYVFARRETKRRSDASGVIVKWRPADEWIVKPDHHEAYLPRETWERIKDSLASRRPTLRPLIGKGDALLQGLLRCGADDCNRRMKTQYWGRDGIARTATYTCLRQNGWGDTTHKVTVPARHIDHALVEHVLGALTAIDNETARDVIERSQLEQATLERAQRRRLLDAEEDLQRIRQLLFNLPPELQHASIDLMAQYDVAARRHLELKTQLATETTSSLSMTVADTGDLIELTRNVRQLWQAPQRTNEERKRLLQAVVSEVILQRADRETADLEIVWKGGLRQVLTVRRPRGVDAYVATQTGTGKKAQQIADELNAAGAITASGRPISTNVVAQKQGRLGIRLKQERAVAREIIRDGLLADRPRPDILRELSERAPRLGPWDPQRLSEAIRHLRRGSSGIEPLPSVLPADERKQHVLNLIEVEFVAGKSWTKIAAALNEAALRPPRGTTFTPVQVRLLYLRARGPRPYGVPSKRREKPTATA